ncbi:MAG: serine/threonine-protein kinase, partial [Myxococcota bacterium]
MGYVWRAERIQDREELALKFIRQDTASERTAERFVREAEHAASVHHANVIEVIDWGLHEGQPYIGMELLKGQGLDERLQDLPAATVGDIVAWLIQSLDGLEAVHKKGIVHRDLKPANLFLCDGADRPVVKLLDFGLSRSLLPSEDGAPSLTQTHQFLGTPYYTSPEQIRSAKHIDARADLYSLGVILYEALAGERPFDGPNATAVIASVVADPPPPLSDARPDLPEELSAIVDRAMAKDPADRFATASEMRRALEKLPRSLAKVRATPRLSGPSQRSGRIR